MRKKTWNFIINGAGTSGKDTFIDLFKKLIIKDSNTTVNNISTVDHIKMIAESYFGWNRVKDEKGRRLLSDLKDVSTRYDEGPFKRVLLKISESKKTTYIINFIHSREPEEIEKFKNSLDNSYTILIRRNVEESFMNHADQNVENYTYDFIFNNSGSITDLENKIKSFIEIILLN